MKNMIIKKSRYIASAIVLGFIGTISSAQAGPAAIEIGAYDRGNGEVVVHGQAYDDSGIEKINLWYKNVNSGDWKNESLTEGRLTAPFEFDFDELFEPGEYLFRAKAFANDGDTAWSENVYITVEESNLPAAVEIGAYDVGNGEVVVHGLAYDDSVVEKIDLWYKNADNKDWKLMSLTEGNLNRPFEFSLGTFQPGEYVFRAKATANDGDTAWSKAVFLTVQHTRNEPPYINVTIEGSNNDVLVIDSYDDSGIKYIDIWTSVPGSDEYTWERVDSESYHLMLSDLNEAGLYIFRVRATANDGDTIWADELLYLVE